MSDNGGDMVETTDFSKMKVNDLKKILKNRGLPMTGNKQELVERLQSTEAPSEDLLDGSDGEDGDLEAELDESCLMGEDAVMEDKDKQDGKTASTEKDDKAEKNEVDVSPSPTNATEAVSTPEDKTTNGTTNREEPEPANTTQQKRKICLKSDSAAAPEIDKKKLRAERFGAGDGDVGLKTDVLAKRAERFAAANSTTTSTTSLEKTKLPQTAEALKKRAERFGILTPAEVKKQHLEKLQARKLRFGTGGTLTKTPKVVTTTVEPTAAPVTLPLGVKPNQLSAEERKKLRAHRFKMN